MKQQNVGGREKYRTKKHIILPLSVNQRRRKYDKRNKTWAWTRGSDSRYRGSEESERNGGKMYFLPRLRQIKSFILRLRCTRQENRLNCGRMSVLTRVALRSFWSKGSRKRNYREKLHTSSVPRRAIWASSRKRRRDTLNGKEFQPGLRNNT